MRKLALIIGLMFIATTAMAGVFTIPEKTADEVKKEEIVNILSDAENLYTMTSYNHYKLFRRIWCNGEYSAQEIFDGMSVESRFYLFALSGGLQEVLTTNPNYNVLVPPRLFEVNPSTGEVTIGDINLDGFVCNPSDEPVVEEPVVVDESVYPEVDEGIYG